MKFKTKEKQDINNILIRILLSYITFITLNLIFNRNNNDRLLSAIFVNCSALIALYILSFRLRQKVGFNLMKIIFIGYFIKLFIGYLFWQLYLFPDYFINPTSSFKFDHYEYLLTEGLMKDIAIQRIAEGFFYFSPTQFETTKHFAIHYFMSNLYLSGSFNPFDVAIQNCLFSIYSAAIILAISKQIGATSLQMKFAVILAIYQPFSMITTIIWRDVVGQFFVAIGGCLIYISSTKKGLSMMFFIIIASLSMYIQRLAYFFFPIFTIIGYYLFIKRNRYKLLFIPIVISFIFYFNNLFFVSDNVIQSYGGEVSSLKLWIYLPINIIRLFIGPFPWTNWFRFDDQTIFLIAEYFQSVITISLVIILLKNLNKRKIPINLTPVYTLFIVLFSLFIVAGLGTIAIHQGYMSIGTIFLIPLVSLVQTNTKFVTTALFVFSLFIILNIITIVLGITGQGFGSSFR